MKVYVIKGCYCCSPSFVVKVFKNKVQAEEYVNHIQYEEKNNKENYPPYYSWYDDYEIEEFEVE